ncbi:MAG: glycosyltransferase family 4 protein [Solirubrobacteraceae bacterium]
MAADADADTSTSQPHEVTIVAHDIGPVGGMERQLVQLISGLRRHGHPITVIGRVCELPPGVEVDFRRVRGPGRPFLIAYPWFLLAGTLAVRRWRRGIVQATGAIVLNQLDTVAVHYCHQAGVATPSRAGPTGRAYIAAVTVLNKLSERLVYGIQRRARFVCVSDGVAEEIRTYFPAAAERVVTIQNGVDLDAFAPGSRAAEASELRQRLGVAPRRLAAAFVGSEWERKGLEPAIRALAQAPEWDLIVAGGGDRGHYEGLARGLGLAGRVHWLGVTKDVPLALAAADALLFPSAYEAFPLVALEAAAAGLPILATPVNGVRELIEDGRSGLLIDAHPASIAVRLGELAADPDLRRRLGAAARESVMRFTWERMVRRHHELFQSLPPAPAGARARRAASAPAGRSPRRP